MVKVKKEPAPTTKKRVKKTTSRSGKRRRTTHFSDSEESEDETKDKPVVVNVLEGRKIAGKKAWKPKVVKMQIINDENFVQLNKYYDLYSNMDQRKLENSIIRNMILRNKRFENIQNKIPEDLYNKLVNRKRRIT